MLNQEKKLVQSFLKELPSTSVIQQTQILKAASYMESVGVERTYKATKPLKVADINLHQDLVHKYSLGCSVDWEILKKIMNLNLSLKPQYSLGDEFQKIKNMEKITFNEDYTYETEEQEFQVEKGIVYILIIWEAWRSEKLQQRINQFKSLLENYPQWQGKVRLVCLSKDYETSEVAERVKLNQWKSIEHFRFLESQTDGQSLEKYFENQYHISEIFINKLGKIDHYGQFFQGNIEDRINELIIAEHNEHEQQPLIQNQEIPQPIDLIKKEEIKELKQQLNIIQTSLTQAKFEEKVEVLLEIIKYLKQDGSKEVQKRPQLVLSYDVNIKEESKIKSFLENYWDPIPENLKCVKQSKIRDPKKLLQDTQKKIQDIFSDLGVKISYTPYYYNKLKYYFEKSEMKVYRHEEYLLKVDKLTIQQYQIGIKKLEYDIQNASDECDSDLKTILSKIIEDLQNCISLKEGQQFQAISNYKKWGSEEFTNIQHIPGQILVLIYFDPQNERSVYDIQGDADRIKKNYEKWGKAVKFVCLSQSISEESELAMKELHDSLDYIDFYFPKEKEQPDIYLYKAYSLPHKVIVDRNRMIRKIGCSLFFVNFINNLIDDKSISGYEENFIDINPEVVDKVLAIFQSAEFQQKLNQIIIIKPQLSKFTVEIEQVQVNGQLKYKIPKLSLLCRDIELEFINQVFKSIFELIPENIWNFSKKVLETFSIPYPGKVCALCDKEIVNEAQQYYSPFNQVHICVECAEFDDKSKKGAERFKCTDNLVFINGPLTDLSVLQNILTFITGKNLKLSEDEEGSQEHSVNCFGCCAEKFSGPRYIATFDVIKDYGSVNFYDYCQNCFVALKDKKSAEAQAIIQKQAKNGMIEDSLFVRILFNHGSYHEF